jgi:hypothetical protein
LWDDFYLFKNGIASIAAIKKRLVERWEFDVPCSIKREKTKKELSKI